MATRTAQPPTSPPPEPKAAAPQLTVSSTTADLTADGQATLTITATGGSLRWQGVLTDTPGAQLVSDAGVLAAGQSTAVHLRQAEPTTATRFASSLCDESATGTLTLTWSSEAATGSGSATVTVRFNPCDL
ncbi:hypothetical protein ACFV1N_46125 [Streptosporangium canum]|uniref:hypothetical protein n=1 Tax=Streptosporangium canum TaxID=324952 RepID=UPI0036B2C846